MLLALSGCACPAPAPEPAPEPIALPEPGVLSNRGTYWVSWAFEPTPIPLNEPFDVVVQVYDARRPARGIDDVVFTIDGRMPEHRHGMNREPVIVRRDAHTFHVSGMEFHMPGEWQIHFDLTRAGRTERAQWDVELD